MTRRWLLLALAWAGLLGLTAPAAAQEASPELRAAGERVVAFLKARRCGGAPSRPPFLAAVPAAQLRRWRIASPHGASLRLAVIEPRIPGPGTIHIEMNAPPAL